MNWVLIAIMGALVGIGFLIDKKRNPVFTDSKNEIKSINYDD